MRAQEYLRQIRKLDRIIQNKMIEQAQWRLMATGTTSRMTEDKIQTSKNYQKMADAMDRYIDLEREIDATIDKLVDVKNEILHTIERLDVVEYDMLHKIYVQYLTLYDVADDYDKSYSWATTIHGIALKNVQKILDERNGDVTPR